MSTWNAITPVPSTVSTADRWRTGAFKRMLQKVLSIQTVLVVCVLSLIAMAVPRSMADPDIWWHLRNGQRMLSEHAFVRSDAMSFTAYGAPWIDHEWFSELPFYIVWRYAGINGVYFLTVALIEAIFCGVFILCRRGSRSWNTAAVTTLLAALLATVSFGPRTLLFGWLCLVVELLLLDRSKTRPNAAFALPSLFALWINLHGSWVIGLVVLFVHVVLDRVPVRGEWMAYHPREANSERTLLFAALAVVPSLLLNPWGWRLVAYPFDLAFRQTLNVANVAEWQPLDLHSLRGKIVVAAVALLAGRQLTRPRKWSLVELALLTLGIWSALNYSRFLFLFAILVAPAVARSLRRGSANVHPGNRLLNVCVLALVPVLLTFSLSKSLRSRDQGMSQFPKEAYGALMTLKPNSRILSEYLWGGYLEWYSPDTRVFIDSRVDIFEHNGTFRDYLEIVRLKNSLALLDRYAIDAVFFEKDTPLVYLLTHSGMWKVSFDDGSKVLLERTGRSGGYAEHSGLVGKPQLQK